MIHFIQVKKAIASMPVRPQSLYPYAEAWTPERLREMRSAPHLQKLIEEIREAAERAVEQPLPSVPYTLFRLFESEGTRKPFEKPFFDRRGVLLALVLATVIDETDRYMDTLQNVIWDICAEYTWCLPAHLPFGMDAIRTNRRPPEQQVDLFAAETAHALAETITLLAGRLDPWIDYRVKSEIERRVLRPLFEDIVPFKWETNPNNWSAVCAGAAGMAALLLVEDRERLAGMIDRVNRAMESFLLGFGGDGGCAEGISYWAYGFGYYTYFADMLNTMTEGELDLLQLPKVKNIAAFPARSCLSGTHYPAFSDADRSWMPPPGLLCRLSSRLGVPLPAIPAMPSFHADHCYRWPTILRNFTWTDPSCFDRPLPEQTTIFPDLQWVVDRGQLEGIDIAFAAKGGHNDEPHNHNDIGHFILYAGGEDMLTDLGAGLYTRDYFGSKRYANVHNNSFGHSVPVIDGHAQQAGRNHSAEMEVVERDSNGDGVLRVSLEAAKAYDAPHLRQWRRELGWERRAGESRAVLHVRDRFAFDTLPGQLEEAWISDLNPEFGEGVVVWTGRKAKLTLRYEPEQFEADAEQLQAANHAGEPRIVNRVRLRAKRLDKLINCDFTFELTKV
ncbi:MAG: hypothetical protein K0Q59_2190 [Paenibacillus sp.]|nr:hypothetical protein [Paenibacillus sp.]